MQYSVMQLASCFPDDYLKQAVCHAGDLFTYVQKRMSLISLKSQVAIVSKVLVN